MDFNQLVETLVTHVQIFLIFVGIACLIVALVDIKIKSIDIHISDKFPKRRLVLGGVGGLLIVGSLVSLLFPSFPPQISPTHPISTATVLPGTTSVVTVAPTSSAHDDSASSLIPAGQQPVINDPLHDNSQGYEWDIQDTAQGNCNFVQGRYILTASAGVNNGIGCGTESAKGNFSNFVYQIEMTILTGVDDDQSGSGPIFRANASNGQQYQVLFDVNGDWQVGTDAKTLTGDMCANPCPYFHTGVNQQNYITIRAAGNFIQIQINGYDLGSYTDSTYSSGAIGVQMNPGTSNSSVTFAEVRVWQL